MVRTASKSAVSAPASSVATTPVDVAPIVETPSVEKPVKKASVKKVKEVVVAITTPEVTSPPTPPTIENTIDAPIDGVVDVEVDVNISSKLSDFGGKLQQLTVLIATIKAEFKALEKCVSRELKNAHKSSSRRKKTTGNRQPSGFIKPTLISTELAAFLEKPVGTEMARTAVSKEINNYIRTNNLQNPTNGRMINADEKLSKLLNLAAGDQLTYFNLQRFMKHHFIKPVVPVVPSVVA